MNIGVTQIMPRQLAVTVSLKYSYLNRPVPKRQIMTRTVDKLADNRCLVTEASSVVEDGLALALCKIHTMVQGIESCDL